MVDGSSVKRDGVLVDVDMAAVRDDLIGARDRLSATGQFDGLEPKLASWCDSATRSLRRRRGS